MIYLVTTQWPSPSCVESLELQFHLDLNHHHLIPLLLEQPHSRYVHFPLIIMVPRCLERLPLVQVSIKLF